MTTTSLQEYLADIDQLLEEEQYESVVGHSYHILKQFPRHVDTYRVLAKGLLGLNRQDEATELFQRILSTDPHDLISHIALADMAQTNGDSDVAQYHLERAFELDPYNGALQEELGRYYDSGDDFGIGRIQLNDGSLAHIYMRGEMYEQATAVLDGLVNDKKDRIDLQVLRAEALWRSGKRVEAADASLRVIDNLPNSIVANAILSDIWFGSNRIGDAKKHARNLQSMVLVDHKSVDPESVVGTALTAEGAPQLPELIQIEMLENISSADVAVSIQDIKPTEDATQEDIESDPGDMYDWLSGVVKPSAEQRMEEVIEPDSWPAGESDIESDWFSDESVPEKTEAEPIDDSFFDAPLELDDLPDPASEDIFEESQKDTADEFVLKFNEQAAENAEVPDWIVTDNAETGQLQSQESADLFPTDETGVPDWLSQAANEDFEPVTLDPLTASQWLNEGTSDPIDDDYENLPDSVKDSQDWLADINKEFSEIVDDSEIDSSDGESWLQDDSLADENQPSEIDDWFSAISDSPLNDDTQFQAPDSGDSDKEESEDWLNNIADQALISDSFENESNPTLETKIVEDPIPEIQPNTSDEDWLSEDWLLDENTAVENDFPAAEVQDLAAIMNDEEPINENETPKKDNEPKKESANDDFSDDWLSQLTKNNDEEEDDWLAELSGGDELLDSIEEKPDLANEEGDSVSDFLAELGADEEIAPLEDDEQLEDINEWLENLSSEQGESPDDWLSNLVDEEGDEESEKIFTDWLNKSVVDEKDAELEAASAASEDLIGDLDDLNFDTDLLSDDDAAGLTDILDAAEESVPEESMDLSESWLDEGTGLTDLLGDLDPLESATEKTPNDDELPDLSDILGEPESESLPSDFIAGSDGDWLDEGTGLTDLLDNTELVEAEDATSEPVEMPSLTELLGEVDSDDDEDAAPLPSLTDLLDESEIPDSAPIEEAPGLTDILGDHELGSEDGQDEAVPSLTDMLESEQLPSEVPVESDGDWLDGEGGLTDMLSEAGLTFESDQEDVADFSPEPSLTDLLDSDDLSADPELEAGLPSLTDMLESEQLPSEVQAESDSDWLDGEGGLTDMLSEAGMTFDTGDSDDNTAVVNDDLLDLSEPPSLTDLLGEDDLEEVSFDDAASESVDDEQEPGLTDMLAEESGLTDLLADSSDPFDILEGIGEPEEPGLTDMLAEGDGLTDMLGDPDPLDQLKDASGSEEPGLTDMLADDSGLTDLLDESDPFGAFEEGTGLTDFLEEAEMMEDDDEAVPTLTDMLNAPDELVSGDDKDLDLEPPSMDEILDGGMIDDSEDDALAAIDTNLPEWLSADEETAVESNDSVPDWMTESIDGFDLEDEALDAEIEADEALENEPGRPSATGLLRKLDDLPGLQATLDEAEEEAQKQAAEEAPFEPEMAEFLTKPDDTAWLNQLGDADDSPGEAVSELDWMKDVSSDPDLDWLDSDQEDEPAVEETEESEEDFFIEEEDSQDTPANLDDAMSWLEDLAAEQQQPIEPLPTVAEVLDDDDSDILNALIDVDESPEEELIEEAAEERLEEENPELEFLFDDEQEDAVSSDDSTEIVEEADSEIDDALSEIDDAMAWLDDLSDQADLLADENNTLVAESEEESAISQPLFETPEPSLDEVVEEVDSEISEHDVPEDIDDAMAWLEQLAAKQGAPIDELPSISEEETAVIESESTIQYSKPIEESDEALSSDLALALDWIENVSDSSESAITPVEKTTTAELGNALDFLEEIANQSVDKDVVNDEVDLVEAPDEIDEAMSWLDDADSGNLLDLDDSSDVVEETAVAEEESLDEEPESIEESEAGDESTVEEETSEEESLEDLFDAGIFDFPDDPDEAMAWLDELSEDEIAENRAARGDEPEDDLSLFGSFLGGSATTDTSEPAEPVEAVDDGPVEADVSDDVEPEETVLEEIEEDVDSIEEELPTTDESTEDETDILTNVPEDPDEAMKWLEQLAARQGAPIEELPSVDEPVDIVDDVPDWIKGDVEESESAVEPVSGTSPLPTLEPESADEPEVLDDTEESADEDELPEGLPDWFSLDEVAEEEIPSQTDWLDSVPEFGGTDWLSSEGEAASTASESTELVPDTGPLLDQAGSTGPLPDLDPLESQPELFDEPAVNDEPDSAVYKLDTDNLEIAKQAISSEEYDGAITTLQSMVAEGNGLMMLIGELESISDENPAQPAFRRLLGDAYMRNGQLQKALATYRQALDQL